MIDDNPSEHGGEEGLPEAYEDYGDYEAGPSGEGDEGKGRHTFFSIALISHEIKIAISQIV